MINILPIRKYIRLRGYDYSDFGSYFITICAYKRKCIFGKIINKKMIEYNWGKIVNYWWNNIPNKFDNVKLDMYQLMPNHFHGIIQIVGAGSSRPLLGQIIGYFKYQCTKQINNQILSNGSDNPTPTKTLLRDSTSGVGAVLSRPIIKIF